ncbi:hypothetical protein N7486_002821 [Penicillium sp. IBT 16267x]|nr:hypothetical protein N7486_002821 [Penicillium sp. IBT 16267x]
MGLTERTRKCRVDAARDKLMEMLLERGADGGYYGNTLQAACFEGQDKLMEMLLERGADVNTQGGYYGNALQAASSEGHHKIVQMLRRYGADRSLPYRSPFKDHYGFKNRQSNRMQLYFIPNPLAISVKLR